MQAGTWPAGLRNAVSLPQARADSGSSNTGRTASARLDQLVYRRQGSVGVGVVYQGVGVVQRSPRRQLSAAEAQEFGFFGFDKIMRLVQVVQVVLVVQAVELAHGVNGFADLGGAASLR